MSVLLEPTEVRDALYQLFQQIDLRRTHLEYVISKGIKTQSVQPNKIKADDRRNPSHVEFDEDVLYHSIFRHKTKVRSLNPDQTLLEWLKENLTQARSEQEKWRAARSSVTDRMAEIKELLKLRDLTWCSVWEGGI